MIIEKQKETRHYEYNYFYPITITKEDNYYEATLYRKEYGISMIMFGTFCQNWEEMLEMVEANVEEYIETFYEMILKIEKAD